jgi:hypothetical protein
MNWNTEAYLLLCKWYEELTGKDSDRNFRAIQGKAEEIQNIYQPEGEVYLLLQEFNNGVEVETYKKPIELLDKLNSFKSGLGDKFLEWVNEGAQIGDRLTYGEGWLTVVIVSGKEKDL